MKTVTFTKGWRGHKAGDTAELTDERADELESAGYFEKPAAEKKTKAATTKKSDAK